MLKARSSWLVSRLGFVGGGADALDDVGAELHGLDHARRIGHAATGDVERGAVIGRSPREWKAERDVHGAAERRNLDGCHADVVIWRDNRVEFAAHRPDEDGIGGKRSGEMRRARRWLEDFLIFP